MMTYMSTNTLIITWVAVVESESSEAKVGGTGKTLRDGVITTQQERDSGTYAWCKVLNVGGVSTELNTNNFWHLPDTLNNEVGEMTGVVLEVIVVDVADTNGTFNGKGVFHVSGLEEI